MIVFTKEEIINTITKAFNNSNAKDIANIIVNITDDHGQGLIIKALLGIIPTCEYKVGDVLWTDINTLGTWRFDKILSKTNGLIHKDHMKAVITKINIYKAYPYSVKYKCYNISNEMIECETEVDGLHFLLPEEYPEPDWDK